MNGASMPSPPPGAPRSIDIELGGQEVITIELDNLDPNPEDLLEVLKEAQCKVWIWTRLAAEYWRRGFLDSAERIAQSALESLQANGATASLPPVYFLLANIHMARASKAPKLVLPNASQDVLKGEKPRDEYFQETLQLMNSANEATTESGETPTSLVVLTRGIWQMGTRHMDDAMRSFDGVLAEKPNNLVALLGKAKILYARRQYAQSLKLFQTVLRLSPDCVPDPRIGIGLCFWALDNKAKAKAAWQRSLEVRPESWTAQLLLGLEAINNSKDETQLDEERADEFVSGTRLIQRAFQSNQKSSAAANALCETFLQKGNYNRALKLAERTIQYADTLTVLTEGYIRAARVYHTQGNIAEATKFYSKAKDGQPTNVLAAVGLAQMQLKNDELPAAIHTLDTLLQPSNRSGSIEATAMLASLRSHPRPGVSSADQAVERNRARELFDQVCRTLGLPESNAPQVNGNVPHLNASARSIAEDKELHIEISKLWQGENMDRLERALKEASRLSEASGQVDPRLTNNLAVLPHLDGNLNAARLMYETALMHASSLGTEEAMSATILYNLARVYEDQGEENMARDAYDKLLARHPEYVDAKLRQAHMLAEVSRHHEAHDLIKQALTSQSNNLNLRAFYTWFLIQSNLPKQAKDFVFATLKDHDNHDLYSLCAAGWIQYFQARENRESSPKGIEERRRGFQRSAEFYEKALHLDPMCAVAAQGLAIVTAEDALGTLGGALGPIAPDEAQKRIKNARDALDIFAKVRESINDGSVYANIGHCYYARDEFDRAIESYETASRRFYHDHDVPVLMCLCRSWYAKANKDQSFSAMTTALQYAQKAYHLYPHDKANLYNIAMIQQKAAEMMLLIKPAKRSLEDLERAIAQAGHAQTLFASLAADKSAAVPYSRDLADQRRKYGDSMLRRCDEHVATQRQFEAESQAKLEDARQKRQEEKDRLEALERERMEQLRKQAEALAEERRRAREQAAEWTREIKQLDSDDEKEKKPRRKKVKAEVASGDEGAPPAGTGEPKKKRRGGKLRKKEEQGDGEEGALFSGDEEPDKPAKKRSAKKRQVRDDEDEEEAGAPRRKQFKSKEYISDSDDMS